MTWAELKRKWSRYARKESAAYQAYRCPPHLTDDQILERLLAPKMERAAAEINEPHPHAPQRTKDESDLL